ncbi:MAG: hypothetical protein K0B14_17545, partial [Anaerolineaceae bacterium]|nr:hypothetical protein [Anaerolineaceae bacterium]
RSNSVRVGMLKSNPRLNPDQNVIPVGNGRVRGNAVKGGHGFRIKLNLSVTARTYVSGAC